MSFIGGLVGASKSEPLTKLHEELMRRASRDAKSKYGTVGAFFAVISDRLGNLDTDKEGCVRWTELKQVFTDLGFRPVEQQKEDKMLRMLGFRDGENRIALQSLLEHLGVVDHAACHALVIHMTEFRLTRRSFAPESALVKFGPAGGDAALVETPRFSPGDATRVLAATHLSMLTDEGRALAGGLRCELWAASDAKRAAVAVAEAIIDIEGALRHPGESQRITAAFEDSKSHRQVAEFSAVVGFAVRSVHSRGKRAEEFPAALRRIRDALRTQVTGSAFEGSLSSVVVLIREAFARFDLDHDGTLSLAEFEEAVKSIPGCSEIPREELVAAMKAFDQGHGDGVIDQDEFLATMAADDPTSRNLVLALRDTVRSAADEDPAFSASFLAFADRTDFDPLFVGREQVQELLNRAGLRSLRNKDVTALLQLAQVGDNRFDVIVVRDLVSAIGVDLVEGATAVVNAVLAASPESEAALKKKGFQQVAKLALPGKSAPKATLFALGGSPLDYDSHAAFTAERVTDITIAPPGDAALRLAGYVESPIQGADEGGPGAPAPFALYVQRRQGSEAFVVGIVAAEDAAKRALAALRPLSIASARGVDPTPQVFLRLPRPSLTDKERAAVLARDAGLARLRRAMREATLRIDVSIADALAAAAKEERVATLSPSALRRMLRDIGVNVDSKDLRFLLEDGGRSPPREFKVKDICKKLRQQVEGYETLLGNLRKAVTKSFPNEPVDKVVKRIDSDGDGEITVAEFIAAARKMKLRVSEHEIQMLVQSFDQDGDGTVDCFELGNALAPPAARAGGAKGAHGQQGGGADPRRGRTGRSSSAAEEAVTDAEDGTPREKGKRRPRRRHAGGASEDSDLFSSDDAGAGGHSGDEGGGSARAGDRRQRTLRRSDLAAADKLVEQLAALLRAEESAGGHAAWRRAFDEFDTRGTGIVRARDFQKVLMAAFSASKDEARAVAELIDASGDDKIDLAEFVAFAREVAEGAAGSAADRPHSMALVVSVLAAFGVEDEVVTLRLRNGKRTLRRAFYTVPATGGAAGDDGGVDFDPDALVVAADDDKLGRWVPRVELVAGRTLLAERRLAIASAEPNEVVEEVVSVPRPAAQRTGKQRRTAKSPRRRRKTHESSDDAEIVLQWVLIPAPASRKEAAASVSAPDEVLAAVRGALAGQVRALRTPKDVRRALQLPRSDCGFMHALAACAAALHDAGVACSPQSLGDTVAAHATTTASVDTESLAAAILRGAEGPTRPARAPSASRGPTNGADALPGLAAGAGEELRRFLARAGVLTRVCNALRRAGAAAPSFSVPARSLRRTVVNALRASHAEADASDGLEEEERAAAVCDRFLDAEQRGDGSVHCAVLFGQVARGDAAPSPPPCAAAKPALDSFAAAVSDPRVREEMSRAFAAADSAGSGAVSRDEFCRTARRAHPKFDLETLEAVAASFAAEDDPSRVRFAEAMRVRADAARGAPSAQARSRVREWLSTTPRSLAAIADTVTAWAVLSDPSGRTMPRNAVREALEECGLAMEARDWVAFLDQLDPQRSGHLAVAKAVDAVRTEASSARNTSDTLQARKALRRGVFAADDGVERLRDALERESGTAGHDDAITRAQALRALASLGIGLAPEAEECLSAAASASAAGAGAAAIVASADSLSISALVRLACPDDRDIAEMREAVSVGVDARLLRDALRAADARASGVLPVREIRQLLLAHGAPLSASDVHALASRHRVPGRGRSTGGEAAPQATYMSLLHELGLLGLRPGAGQAGAGAAGADGQDPLGAPALALLPWGVFHPLVRRWLDDGAVPEDFRRAFARAAAPLATYVRDLVASGEAAPMAAQGVTAPAVAPGQPAYAAASAPPADFAAAARGPFATARAAAAPPPSPSRSAPAAALVPPTAAASVAVEKSQAAATLSARAAPPRGPWDCDVCFFRNEAAARACAMCASDHAAGRAAAQAVAAPGPAASAHGTASRSALYAPPAAYSARPYPFAAAPPYTVRSYAPAHTPAAGTVLSGVAPAVTGRGAATLSSPPAASAVERPRSRSRRHHRHHGHRRRLEGSERPTSHRSRSRPGRRSTRHGAHDERRSARDRDRDDEYDRRGAGTTRSRRPASAWQ